MITVELNDTELLLLREAMQREVRRTYRLVDKSYYIAARKLRVMLDRLDRESD